MEKLEFKDRPKVLVVEGYSDLLFYAEVLEYLKKQDQVFIKQLNGKDDLFLKLEDFLAPDLIASKESIGVIVDADNDAVATSNRLAMSLRQIFSRPDLADGLWVGEKPQVGFFVAPGNRNKGEVETLVWQAWSNCQANIAAKQCIDAYISCMAQRSFQSQSPDKGRIGSLLAIRADEDPRLGPGARRNIFDFSWPEFSPLTKFLSGI